MIEAPVNHPGDEALLALSLGFLADAELAHISSHLGGCPACCQRIDQLSKDDALLSRLQRSATNRGAVLGTPDQHRSAVRALRRARESGSALRQPGSGVGAVSWIANAAAEHGIGDVPASDALFDEFTTLLAAPAQPDEIGRLGPYRILAVLGRGGMGVVFRAHDPGLDRLVALKAMLPRMAAVPSARERFVREAKAVAALKHSHVVTVFQVGEDRGIPFLAMEFLEGEPLDDRIRRDGRLPLADILRIGREAALGLAAAHARGLVHRDIKPANLWLEGPTGHVKILDFGLAHAASDATQLTQFGLILGTPAYMAPEQAEGKPVDPRCDLFSLGCVLYQMSTGLLPYHGETTIAVLRALAMHEPPPVRGVRPEAPRELSDLVARLLAKKPDERPSSAAEVADTLRSVEHLPPAQLVPTPELTPPRKSRKPRVALAAGTIAVALALTLVLWPTPRGTIRIESDDPAVQVVIDKNGPTIKGADKDPITLRAGEHGVLIKRGDFAFEADKLLLKKGAALTLRVEMLPGTVQILQGGKVLTTQEMPVSTPPPAKAPFNAEQARDYQKAWAKHLHVPLETTNPLGMKFRLIPPGEFTMGVTAAEAESWSKLRGAYVDETKRSVPAHTVRLTRPFYVSETEVRYGDFIDVMKHDLGRGAKRSQDALAGPITAWCPWIDCIEFCNRLSAREGRSPAYTVSGHNVTVNRDATGYRLPTEAEWEFACRAGTTSLWYFGMTAEEAERMCVRNLGEAAAYLRTRTADPNPFGLVRMYASGAEWCWDWYSSDYYRECANKGVVVDPQGPESGTMRITRGGSCYAHSSGDLVTINSAARDVQDPIESEGVNGFGRLVLPIPAKDVAK